MYDDIVSVFMRNSLIFGVVTRSGAILTYRVARTINATTKKPEITYASGASMVVYFKGNFSASVAETDSMNLYIAGDGNSNKGLYKRTQWSSEDPPCIELGDKFNGLAS